MRCDEAAYFGATLQAQTLIPSAGCVLDAHVGAAAGIAASKMHHRHSKSLSQTGSAATATHPIHVVQGATATLLSFKAGSIAIAAGAATVEIDLKKNGASILTAPITLDSANTARVLEAGTLSATALVAGDFLEVAITATAGGGTLPTGLLVQLELDEAPT